jgi:hypothetical protein
VTLSPAHLSPSLAESHGCWPWALSCSPRAPGMQADARKVVWCCLYCGCPPCAAYCLRAALREHFDVRGRFFAAVLATLDPESDLRGSFIEKHVVSWISRPRWASTAAPRHSMPATECFGRRQRGRRCPRRLLLPQLRTRPAAALRAVGAAAVRAAQVGDAEAIGRHVGPADGYWLGFGAPGRQHAERAG